VSGKVGGIHCEHDDSWWKIPERRKDSADELRASIRRSTIALKLVPVLAGSALRTRDSAAAHAVVDFLPSPLDVPPSRARQPTTKWSCGARATKSRFRHWRSRLCPTVRRTRDLHSRYSGVLKAGSYVYNSTKSTRERVGRLLRMHANKREEIDAIYAGISPRAWA